MHHYDCQLPLNQTREEEEKDTISCFDISGWIANLSQLSENIKLCPEKS